MFALCTLNIIYAAVILLGGRWVAKWLMGIASKLMEQRGVDPTLAKFGANVMYVGLIAFVVVAVLGQLGIQTASFVAIIGAAGLAIALAFQGSLSNLAAGVLLVSFRPFKLGDFVEAGGTMGIVEKIEIFTTQIYTPDNKTIIVPNAQVIGGNIVNYSSKPTQRVDLVVGVSYDDDLDQVRKVLLEILAADQRVLGGPESTIRVLELADSSVNFAVRPWVTGDDYRPVYFDLHAAIRKHSDSEGINIPFPQRVVHMNAAA